MPVSTNHLSLVVRQLLGGEVRSVLRIDRRRMGDYPPYEQNSPNNSFITVTVISSLSGFLYSSRAKEPA